MPGTRGNGNAVAASGCLGRGDRGGGGDGEVRNNLARKNRGEGFKKKGGNRLLS